ncbi:MAG: hypothetical protein WCB68_06390 [Pyrinomonadaceae bacterium]
MSQKNIKRKRPARDIEAAREELERLAARQGVKPITDIDELYGDFWPEDEDVDEFIRTVREWRNLPDTRSLNSGCLK